jgi:hypothetical protein
MNKVQRLVLIGFICVVVLMILFPPVQLRYIFGYSTIWNPQVSHKGDELPATIRYMLLLIQLLGASLVSFAGYMLARK